MRGSAKTAGMTAVVLAGWLLGASAQELNTQNSESEQAESDLDAGRITDDDPLTGIIINRTITVLGWNFYRFFTDIWQSLYPDSDSSLTIVERPTAQFGSEIWIDYRDITVFHTFLPPARTQLRDISKEAVAIAHDNVQTINIEREHLQDDDLGPEEL